MRNEMLTGRFDSQKLKRPKMKAMLEPTAPEIASIKCMCHVETSHRLKSVGENKLDSFKGPAYKGGREWSKQKHFKKIENKQG